jgi:proteasome accessory factor B
MKPIAITKRYLLLIRLTKRPYTYPNITLLLERLAANDHNAGRRTIERDFERIKAEYGIEIRYDHYQKGYYHYIPADEDVADFDVFISLLERCERMEFLNKTITNVQDVGQYLQLEHNHQFIGTNLLPDLWEALRGKRIISFDYTSYDNLNKIPEARLVEPGILFEYKNRWYLDGWDINRKGLRTYGLDRISHLSLTDLSPTPTKKNTHSNPRHHVIGVTCPPGSEPVRVLLRFTAKEAQFVRSLPLHPSQKELTTALNGWIDFELSVILNHELEREILAFGELVQVIEPLELRDKIAERVRAMALSYDNLE